MFRSSLIGLDRKRLRLWLALFFLALAVPTVILIHQAYSQLKWEAFHQHRVLAEELAARIDTRFIELINDEERRSFADYAFLVVAGDPSANFVQRSPLSAYPVESAIPGLIGYFQVDADGAFSTPLLPQVLKKATTYGISGEELTQRSALKERIQQILSQNRLVQSGQHVEKRSRASATVPASRQNKLSEGVTLEAAAGAVPNELLSKSELKPTASTEQVPAQAAFDQLKEPIAPTKQKRQEVPSALGRVEDLNLDYRYQKMPAKEMPRPVTSSKVETLEKRGARKERSTVPVSPSPQPGDREAEAAAAPRIRISTFESEIDPFEFSLLDSGHIVLFRKVWRDGRRYIQGALIDQRPFIQGVIEAAYGETILSQTSNLIVAYQGNVLSAFTGRASSRYLLSTTELQGALLYQTRLSAPLNDLELIFSINRLPAGAGATVITWVAAILVAVLCVGFYLMYRLGLKQIALTRQQQDFISAVSHELKTPLTSIRMFGEMLREGWASEEKKKTYYDYIHDESERLSRLINNVLQLARMTRNELQVNLRPVAVPELIDLIRSKVSSQIERAGFKLNLNCEGEAGQAVIQIDPDCFIQIVINLVDNALKFSSKAEARRIDIASCFLNDRTVLFTVRDYGPGVPKDQMKKIFKLFYRSENELTRQTVGTGIGLALVHQLASAMNGQVDVVNRQPGAEFRVFLPTLKVCYSV